MPRVASEVPVVSGAVPIPIAGEPVVLAECEEPEELELADDDEPVELPGDDDVEPPVSTCSAFCTAADSSELTRFKAVPLARLDRPFDSSTMAAPITLISESCADVACD